MVNKYKFEQHFYIFLHKNRKTIPCHCYASLEEMARPTKPRKTFRPRQEKHVDRSNKGFGLLTKWQPHWILFTKMTSNYHTWIYVPVRGDVKIPH